MRNAAPLAPCLSPPTLTDTIRLATVYTIGTENDSRGAMELS